MDGWDVISSYTTTKRITIKAKALRLPELILIALIGIYIIGYQIIWKLSFLGLETCHDRVLLDIKAPTGNLGPCTNQSTCLAAYAIKSAPHYAYCHSFSGKEAQTPRSDIPCSVLDESDLEDINACYNSGLFVATNWRVSSESKCQGTECSRPWKTEETREGFSQGIEDFHIRFRHRFFAPTHTSFQHYTQSQAMGLLKFHGEVLPRRIQFSEEACSASSTDCRGATHWKSSYPETCGSDSFNAHGRTCVSTEFGDYISLGVLLRAAGVDLDAPTEDNSSTYRRRGTIIHLRLSFTNVDPTDYWSWPFGCMAKYVLEPIHAKYSSFDDVEVKRIHYAHDGQKRESTSYQGVVIMVSSFGAIGDLNFYHFLLSIVVSLSMLGWGHLFVDFALVKLYLNMGWFRNASKLHELHTNDVTMNSREMNEVHDATTFESLDHQARLDREAKLLDDELQDDDGDVDDGGCCPRC